VNWLAVQLGAGIWFVNLVCAVIFTAGLVSLCRWQPNPSLAMLVAVPYLVIVVSSYTRQAAALGFIMLAITAHHRCSIFKMLAYLVLAALFHKAAVVVLPLLGIAASRWRMMTIAMVALIAPAIYSLYLNDAVDKLMTNYIAAQYESSGATVRVLMNVVPGVIFMVFRKRFQMGLAEKRLWTLFSTASLAALMALAISPSSTAVDRLALFLIPLQVVVISRIPNSFGAPSRPAFYLVAAVIAYSFLVEMIWLNFG